MIGRTLAHYEITSQLGKGGMGEVYRARDTKLDRDVALKVLPQEMSGDPERKARFEREARSLASLQHPNVASIYGFEEADGVRFLVMELVEGEDLSRRLELGSIAPDEARQIARQIAAGLEAAHDTGLVHRDLKPANVMLGPEGEVKILDFGLARAWFGEIGEDADPSMSPTITAAMTQAGTILGTAAYMSPEQARGRKVDRRADIWAFGVILYEMLSGHRLFEGDTISDTLAAVLRAEPDWQALPADEAPDLCHLVRRCLARDPRQRLRDIGEARLLLEPGGAELSQLGMSMAAAPVPVPPQRRWVAFAVTAIVALGLGAIAGMKLLGTAPDAPAVHALIAPPDGRAFAMDSAAPAMAVPSPDGRLVVFGVEGEQPGQTLLYLRRVDQGEATLLSGTTSAAYPFWSPDSEFVGFFDIAGDKLRKIAVKGGPPTTLCPAPNGKGGSWNREGTIIFAPSHDSPIHRVADTGGAPEPVTELAPDVNSHRHPRFMPDGRHFVYMARPLDDGNDYRVMFGSLDGGEPRELTRAECQAEFSDGHLLLAQEDVLMATPFDPVKGAFKGGSFPVVEDIREIGATTAAGPYSVNRQGMLLYQIGTFASETYLVATGLGDGGRTIIGEGGRLNFPRVSPDGLTAVIQVSTEGDEGVDLWLVDLQTGLRTRFTFAEGNETFPEFSPDGSTVAYAHQLDEACEIVLQPVEGTAPSQILFESRTLYRPSGFSPDGSKLLATSVANGDFPFDVVRFDLEDPVEPEVLVSGPSIEGGARYSPDGRWISYYSNASEEFCMYVIPAEGGARKWQLNSAFGAWGRWHPDGESLLYIGLSGSVMQVSVDGSGSTLRIGATREIARVAEATPDGPPFDVSPDGQRIYGAAPDPEFEGGISLIHLITDWKKSLTR